MWHENLKFVFSFNNEHVTFKFQKTYIGPPHPTFRVWWRESIVCVVIVDANYPIINIAISWVKYRVTNPQLNYGSTDLNLE